MLSGISIWQLLILLAIVVMVFGTKRLRNLGGDLGGALKDFRNSMKQGEDEEEQKNHARDSDEHRVIDQDADGTTRKSEDTASHDRTP